MSGRNVGPGAGRGAGGAETLRVRAARWPNRRLHHLIKKMCEIAECGKMCQKTLKRGDGTSLSCGVPKIAGQVCACDVTIQAAMLREMGSILLGLVETLSGSNGVMNCFT